MTVKKFFFLFFFFQLTYFQRKEIYLSHATKEWPHIPTGNQHLEMNKSVKQKASCSLTSTRASKQITQTEHLLHDST